MYNMGEEILKFIYHPASFCLCMNNLLRFMCCLLKEYNVWKQGNTSSSEFTDQLSELCSAATVSCNVLWPWSVCLYRTLASGFYAWSSSQSSGIYTSYSEVGQGFYALQHMGDSWLLNHALSGGK